MYQATDLHTNTPVILKYIKVPSVYDYSLMRREVDNHFHVNAHPYIIKMLDCMQCTDRSTRPPSDYMVLVLEQWNMDLDQLKMAVRGSPEPYFEEDYLWGLVHECVEALAYAQDYVSTIQDICHRCIEPSNILLGIDGHIRISDFSSSKHVQQQEIMALATLKGPPKFLSPLLRQFLMAGQIANVRHDPYKSDVYSLGYVFLLLSLDSNPRPGQGTEAEIYSEVQKLSRYTEKYRQFIFWMLRFNECDRPNFQLLRDWLRRELFPVITTPEAPASCIVQTWHSRSSDTQDPPVVLPCDSTHIVCSTHCFRDYVIAATQQYALDLDAVMCPICHSPVPVDIIYQAFGSKRQFKQERDKVGVCFCGNNDELRKRYKCSHRICKGCWQRHQSSNICPIPQCGESKVENSCSVF